MRDIEQQAIALACLELAIQADPPNAVATAERFYAFVIGDDDAQKIAAIREVLK